LTEVSCSLPALTSNSAAISAANATAFTAPQLVVTGDVTTAGGATSRIDIASLTGTDSTTMDALTASTTGILAFHNQVGDINFGVWFGASLKSLIIGGKANANSASQANAITVDQRNSALTGITIIDSSVISAFTVSGTAAVVTLTTAGAIRDFTAKNAAAMASLNFGHSHIQGTGSDAATIVVSNTNIAALDMSTMNKVKTITVTGNGALASLTAPNPTNEQGFAEPSAAIAITVSNNLLPGVYTPAVDGTEVTDHVNASLTSAAVSSFKAYIDKFIDSDVSGGNVRTAGNAAARGTGTYISNLTFSIGLDNVDDSSTAATETSTLNIHLTADTDAKAGADDDATATADNQNDAGDITTYNELALVSATATSVTGS
tara:strand:+ start:61 stop:1191 length:1131 start_codon:yes stop_codon:yes gene_type:complete